MVHLVSKPSLLNAVAACGLVGHMIYQSNLRTADYYCAAICSLNSQLTCIFRLVIFETEP